VLAIDRPSTTKSFLAKSTVYLPKMSEKGNMMAADKSVLERSISGSKTIEEGLASEGQVEELRREFSVWSLGSLCLCLMATWEAVTSVVAAALTNGGAPCLFYN
jgi:hypothetical protein